MKVLYLKDNYDIWLKITVPDVAYLKRIKPVQTDSLYILETYPPAPASFPPKMINYGMRVLECLQGRTQYFFTREQ
jgi:hypothetical protein